MTSSSILVSWGEEVSGSGLLSIKVATPTSLVPKLDLGTQVVFEAVLRRDELRPLHYESAASGIEDAFPSATWERGGAR